MTRLSKLRWCLLISLAIAPAFARAQSTPVAATPPEGMVLVPAGEFTMGTDFEDPPNFNLRQFIDAQPEHTRTLPAFYIDRTEVTNAAYKRYCDATAYPPPPHWKDGNFPDGEADFPVTHVNWWEAGAYANWAGKRLPTEAEWEKAARGTDKRKYPWGETWNESLVVLAKDKARAVATKPEGASPYGALDMSGNVQEWVQDWYAAYPGAKRTFPEFGTQFKVARGGIFWSGGAQLVCITFYRSLARPETRNAVTGFRCVRDVK